MSVRADHGQPLSEEAFYLLEALVGHYGRVFGFSVFQLPELTPELDRDGRARALGETMAARLIKSSEARDGTTGQLFLSFDIVDLPKAERLVAARYRASPLGLRSRLSGLAEPRLV